jgi:hypothetical protein
VNSAILCYSTLKVSEKVVDISAVARRLDMPDTGQQNTPKMPRKQLTHRRV